MLLAVPSNELLMHLCQLSRRPLLVYRPKIIAGVVSVASDPMRRLEEREGVMDLRTAAKPGVLSFDLQAAKPKIVNGIRGNPERWPPSMGRWRLEPDRPGFPPRRRPEPARRRIRNARSSGIRHEGDRLSPLADEQSAEAHARVMLCS